MHSQAVLLITVIYVSIIRQTSSAGLTSAEVQYFQDNGATVSSATVSGIDYWLIEHSGIPNHATQQVNPNTATDQAHDYYIPKAPVDKSCSDSYGCVPMGVIAVAVNGVPLFNPYTSEGYNAVEGANKEAFDSCDGHPTDTGTYHYHMSPGCVYNGTNMQFVGVALDGNPIFGVKNENGVDLTSADLDVCHGRMYDGRYIYHLTNDFPYILGCYHSNVKDESSTYQAGSFTLPCYALCQNPRTDSSSTCSTVSDAVQANSLCSSAGKGQGNILLMILVLKVLLLEVLYCRI